MPPLASPTAHWGTAHLLAVLVVVAACWAAQQLLVPILLAFFFLVYGQDLQRQAIARLQAAEHQQLTVGIPKTIEADLSRYVLTISAINAALGLLLTAALYLVLHVAESQFLTPVILGRRMAISPLAMLLWLMLWGFVWGVAGLLLAVPMLASMKIVAERIERWQPWAKLIE